MRFSILLITLALLPLGMILHGWIFTEQQQPRLREEILAALREQGVRGAVADLRYLDLRVAGNAPDLDSLAKARAAIQQKGLIRVVADELCIPASLRARLEGDRLSLEGWLPGEASIREVSQLLGKLRPDLKLDTEKLRADVQVKWPEGEKGPLSAESSLVEPLLEKLRVSCWIDLVQDERGLRVEGILPANGLKAALKGAFEKANTDGLLESTHSQPAMFAEAATLLPLVKGFFASPGPRRLSINIQGEPLLEAPATTTLESEWLALLRPVTGGKKVAMKLARYPSEFHFPGRKPGSPLPPEKLESLKQALSGLLIRFSSGSATLMPDQQARLAALTPVLLAAGPAVGLIIGGHPDPEASPTAARGLALARAQQVHSFLVEQGLPASDVKTVAFDAVPPGTEGAAVQIDSVEILLR